VRVDPLEPVVDPHVGNRQQSEAVEIEQALDMGGAGEQPVGDEEQAVAGRDGVGGVGGGACDNHFEALAAQPVHRRDEIGGDALDGDDDRIGSGARDQPDLPLDQRPPAERQRRAQASARLVGFVIGGDERGEAQVRILPFQPD
jgi:hypothetical protein